MTSAPRRRISRQQRERIFQNAGSICQKCGCSIDIDAFHVAHLRAHTHGGAAVDDNLEAWCSRCNLTQGPEDVRDTRWTPREWQLNALDGITKRIIADGAATVSAAPGAGKTVFAALVFEALREMDVVDRLVVVVPRKTLVNQWAKALERSRHLQLKQDSAFERPGQDGVVVSYQSLTTESVEIHRAQCVNHRTLVVLDEVHHVGETINGKRAWARSVEDLVGTLDGGLHVRGVLNLSGTLWRSSKKEQIATVRYKANELGGLTSEVDYSIAAKDLIQAGELRPLDLFRLDARVEMKDWAELSVTESDIADLDEKPARAAVRALAKSDEWRQAFVTSVLNRLEQAHYALDGHHSKALIVASYQEDARLFCGEVDRQMRERGLQPLAEIATSDEKDAENVLKDFRLKKRVGVLCTVGMAGEGYDCPDIAVVGYASNKLTQLYVRQVVARAMRVTDIERKLQIIPAAIVVPDIPVLVDHLLHYLKPQLHDVVIPDDEEQVIGRAGHGDGGGAMRWSRFEFENIQAGRQTVTVSDGEGQIHLSVDDVLVAKYAELLIEQSVPGVLAPRAMAAFQQLREVRPFDDVPNIADLASDAVKRQMTVEEECHKRQHQLHKLEGWWRYNGEKDMPVQFFAADANRESGIDQGGREQATLEQLKAAVGYEAAYIDQYCKKTGKRRPKIMNGEM